MKQTKNKIKKKTGYSNFKKTKKEKKVKLNIANYNNYLNEEKRRNILYQILNLI